MRREKPIPFVVALIAALTTVLPAAPGAAPQASPDAALDEAMQTLAAYEFGEPRAPLVLITDRVRAASGDPEASAQLERRLIALLEGAITDDCRRFVCRQLELIGTDACVDALASLLDDDELADHAIAALQVNPSDAAVVALIEALIRFRGARRIALIDAVAARGEAAPLVALSADPDEATAVAAIEGLGRIGNLVAAALLLERARVEPPEGPVGEALLDAMLRCAWKLRLAGRLDEPPALAMRVLEWARDDHTRVAAMRELAEQDPQMAARIVQELLGDPQHHAAAASIVRTAGDESTSATIAALIIHAKADQAVVLITALGERGDEIAAPTVAHMLAATDPAVRRAAVGALGSIGTPASVAPLAELAAHRLIADEVRLSLRRMRSPGVDEAIAAALGAEDPAARVALLHALAERRAVEQSAAALAVARRDPDAAVRRTAIETLRQIGRPSDLDGALELLISTDDADDRANAVDAVAAICRQLDDHDARARTVVDAMSGADVEAQRALLAVCGPIGGGPALGATRAAVDDETLRAAAVSALALWPDDEPAGDLLEIATTSSDPQLARIALRGYVRLAGFTAARSTEEGLTMYRRALELSDRPDDRIMVLTGLARVGDRRALPLAESLAAEPMLTDAATGTIITIAQRIAESDPETARAAIIAALARHETPPLREQAGRIVDRIEANRDHVTSWLVAGPFTATGAGATELFDMDFAPQRGDEEPVAWAPLAVTDPDSPGRFDLVKAIGGGDRCAYVKTILHAERTQRVRLELGSDDGIKAWLNGKVVHANNALRGLTPGEDRAEIELGEGRNTLMLKVTQGGGDWAFTCRIRDPAGFHADGVRFATPEELSGRPDGARSLLDGDGGDRWSGADGGLMPWSIEAGELVVQPGTGSIVTRDRYQDFLLHVGFMIPEGLGGSGQGRGNSGVYLQRRYEVQILESSGDAPAPNGCGALYGRTAPRVNAARDPGAWQSYVIDFTAPGWGGDGTKVADARVSVWHNGVLVHDDVPIAGPTGAGDAESPEPGPILLQDHGQPIRFRDIWIARKPPRWEGPGAPGFVPLFDDRTLDGWTQRGGAADYRVESGQIVGTTRPNQPNSFLCTDVHHDDFVLELEFTVHPELNSGIQIRSNSMPDYQNGRVHGYQVEIDPSERAWSAGIYDESRRGWLATLEDNERARRAFRPDGWNRLRIVARGDLIETWLNGVPAARLVDSMTASGFIGLQVHGVGDRADPLEVRWRDIRVKALR